MSDAAARTARAARRAPTGSTPVLGGHARPRAAACSAAAPARPGSGDPSGSATRCHSFDTRLGRGRRRRANLRAGSASGIRCIPRSDRGAVRGRCWSSCPRPAASAWSETWSAIRAQPCVSERRFERCSRIVPTAIRPTRSCMADRGGCEVNDTALEDSVNAWRLETPGARRLAADRAGRGPEQVLHGLGGLPRERARTTFSRAHRARVPRPPAAHRGRRERRALVRDAKAGGRSGCARTRGEHEGAGGPACARRPARPRGAHARPRPRRRRRRDRVPEQGPLDVGDARPDVRERRCASVYNEWAWRGVRRLQRPHLADGRDRAGRPRRSARRDRVGRARGLPRPHACRASRTGGRPTPSSRNYNLPEFDRLWAAISDVDLPITFHVSTGRDPRAARGSGGAVINYVDPLARADDGAGREPLRAPACSSASRSSASRPSKRASAGCRGRSRRWTRRYRKHHMWAFPKLELLPSEYYRRQGFASFQEDAAGSRRSPSSSAWSTTSCGRTTTRTTRASWPHSARGDRAHDGPPDRRLAREDPRAQRGAPVQARRCGLSRRV